MILVSIARWRGVVVMLIRFILARIINGCPLLNARVVAFPLHLSFWRKFEYALHGLPVLCQLLGFKKDLRIHT
jgi:hypothetical protein